MNEDTQEIDVSIGKAIKVVALSVKTAAIRCRIVSTGQPITYRKVRNEVEGEILTIIPAKVWRYGKTYYLTGEIISRTIDIPQLNIEPLALNKMSVWDPRQEYWEEPDDPLNKYFKSIVASGERESYEMDQIIPGQDPKNFDSDPIIEASDFHAYGNYEDAFKIMEKILTTDLRCLDAHAQLGNWEFNSTKKPYEMIIDKAKRHYEVGVNIGELSLGKDFNGVLPWGHINNRPFLRCMQGYGLSLWRLGKSEEARNIFEKMLWLNPSDNQGVRFLLSDIEDGKTWYDCDEQ